MKKISETSPLYDFWKSAQDEKAEQKRLLKFNPCVRSSNLFRNEPYKWEILYQSILRRIISGDDSSIKGLMILLDTLNLKEKEKTINSLESFLDKGLIDKLKLEDYQNIQSSKNFITSIIIFWNIFINPFDLVIKVNKNHIYEKTGMFFYKLRKTFF